MDTDKIIESLKKVLDHFEIAELEQKYILHDFEEILNAQEINALSEDEYRCPTCRHFANGQWCERNDIYQNEHGWCPQYETQPETDTEIAGHSFDRFLVETDMFITPWLTLRDKYNDWLGLEKTI